MYIYPQPHKCPKCGYASNYGPHDDFAAPVLIEGPICPNCYAIFLRANCGVMAPQADHRVLIDEFKELNEKINLHLYPREGDRERTVLHLLSDELITVQE